MASWSEACAFDIREYCGKSAKDGPLSVDQQSSRQLLAVSLSVRRWCKKR